MLIRNNNCPACLDLGKLKYPEKIDPSLFTDLTFASRKRPELMHYELYECKNCKSLFTNRDVDLINLLSSYEQADYDSNIEASFAAQTYIKNIKKALPGFSGSVLDIGAGDGAFLSLAHKNFAKSNLGIEPSIKAIAKCQDLNVNLIDIAIEDFQSEEKFDLVTCFQTIEHLNDPRQFIQNIKSHIKNGGYIAISCHNRLSFVNKILGEKSPIFDVEHLQVFTDKGIELLFKSLDLEIVYSKKYRNVYPLSYWIKIAPVGARIKDFVERHKQFFSYKLYVNVGNHLIIGRYNY